MTEIITMMPFQFKRYMEVVADLEHYPFTQIEEGVYVLVQEFQGFQRHVNSGKIVAGQ